MTTQTQAVPVVGSKEFVDFPDMGVFDVPAKIDTGADSSAIWASDIHEEDGVLLYVLFDKLSPFYTGKVVRAKNFSVASIKNSFGQTEFRYKVSHKTRLGGRTIRVRYTLANRENNSSPILIGRRTLHGKFLVDVSADNQQVRTRRMLLMSGRITGAVGNFAKAVAAHVDNLEVTHASYDDIQFVFGPHCVKITMMSTGEDIASYDIVHFKTSREYDISAAMGRYLQRRGVKIVDEVKLNYPASSKLYQYIILTDNGISIPDSVFVMPTRLSSSYQRFADALGVPFVLKGIHASKGDHNYLVRSEAEFKQICDNLEQGVTPTRDRIVSKDIYLIAQRFIANDGDYRVLVFGRRLALVIYRSRLSDDTHLNNTSQGGAARIVPFSEFPTDVQKDSIIAAKVLHLGAAGVDMVQEKGTDNWYCFEVNDGPQLASGAFVQEKQQAFAKYIETELNK